MAWTIRESATCTAVFLILMVQAAMVCFATMVTFVCLRPFSLQLYQTQLAHVLGAWSQNLLGLVQWLAPSRLVLYFDESCPPSTLTTPATKTPDGKQPQATGELKFPDRAIFIANHQIYADWIYVWFLAYLAKAHGSLKIVLKNELRYLPFFGLGMQLLDFIFMKRRLVDDKDTIIQNLERSKVGHKPMWLVLFPEGTVISKEMRARSEAYAMKHGMNDNLFTLLPRSTGLKLCTATLGTSVEWMYDLTIGYPGIQAGQIPEDTIRLKQIFTGRGPQQIHIHIRRYRISDLPLHDDDAFAQWVMDRWVEKDKRMEEFYEQGRFTSFDHGDDNAAPILAGQHTYDAPIRLQHPLKESLGLWIYLVPYLPIFYLSYSLVGYLLLLRHS